MSQLPNVQPADPGDRVMNSINEELRALGFHRAGTVYPEGGQCRVEIDWDLDGFAIYAMVVGNEIKKFGTTGRKNSRLKSRMISTFSALRQTIKKGPPYLGDPFKTHGPAPILENKKIELWAKPSTEASLEVEESELNNRYRPEWTKEGR
jgi:hypothetical protein